MGTKEKDEAMDLTMDSPLVVAVQQMKAYEKLGKTKKERVSPWISVVSSSRLKVLGAFRNKTITEMVAAAIDDYIKKEAYALDEARSLFKKLTKDDYETTP